MVKFSSIILVPPEGRDLGFSSIDLFDEFRHKLWEKQGNPDLFLEEQNKQKNLENRLEREHNLRGGSLQRTCLVFGTRARAHENLASYLVRDVITDPQATATIRIELYRDNVMTKVHRNGMRYVCSFPRSHALLPANLNLEEEYRAFAKGKTTYLDGSALCIK